MIVVRPAGQADAAGIARVHVETWRSAYAGILPNDYLVGLSDVRHASAWQRTLSEPLRQHGTFVAADRERGIVGFASSGRVRRSPTVAGEDWSGAGEVYTLYVAPDDQNQGIGRRLLSASFAYLVELGYERAVVWVLASNPSRFFYTAMSGRQIGVQQEAFAGQTVEEIAYGWSGLPAVAAELAAAVRRQTAGF